MNILVVKSGSFNKIRVNKDFIDKNKFKLRNTKRTHDRLESFDNFYSEFLSAMHSNKILLIYLNESCSATPLNPDLNFLLILFSI